MNQFSICTYSLW